jgi:hypothetical protein
VCVERHRLVAAGFVDPVVLDLNVTALASAAPLSTLPDGITSRLFRNVHHRAFWTQQLAVARDEHLIADLEGPTFISRAVMQRRVDRRYS